MKIVPSGPQPHIGLTPSVSGADPSRPTVPELDGSGTDIGDGLREDPPDSQDDVSFQN